MRRSRGVGFSVLLAVGGLACNEGPTATETGFFDGSDCDVPADLLVATGVGPGAIPALSNPELVGADPVPGNAYLRDDDRVVGIELAGEAIAIPHNILWYHEIVNLSAGEESVVVTYCPLTGSSLAFDRASVGGGAFGVSGLLYMNNLIMFNRGEPESLWSQMLGEARCKAEIGRRLERVAAFEMTWGAWKRLHPETGVISSDANISRDYTLYPYGDYESLDNPGFLHPSAMPPADDRRAAKERVLGLPSTQGGEPGVAFPFLELDAAPGSWTVVTEEWDGRAVVVLWSDQDVGGGVFTPLHPTTGEGLTFGIVDGEGLVDIETGTRWSVDGIGLSGPLAGERLAPVADAYVAFWGAWAAFHPGSRLWLGES